MSYSRPDSSDPVWKYSFWPKTNDKNCLECKLCGNQYNGGIRRMKVHLTGIGTDARKSKLRSFVQALEVVGRYGVGLRPPTYHEVRDLCLGKEVENTKELFLLQQTSWRKYGCTIMLDDLGNINGKRIIIFLANCPGRTFFLKSIDASCKIHDHNFLYSELDKVVEEIGEEHVVQVVSQNGEAYMKAGKLLMEKRKCLIYAPCISHSIDLILTDFSETPVTKSVIIDARKVTSFIYSHKLILAFIRKETGVKNWSQGWVTIALSVEVVSKRWDEQCNQPLHGAGYFLNPCFYYDRKEVEWDYEAAFFACGKIMTRSPNEEDKILTHVDAYKNARDLFGKGLAIRLRSKKQSSILKQFSLRLDALEVNLEATDNARYAKNMEWEGRFQELQDRVEHHAWHVEGPHVIANCLQRQMMNAFFHNIRQVQHGEQSGSQSRHPPTEEQIDAQYYEEEDAVGAFPQWCNAVTMQVGNPKESLTGEKPKDMPPKKKGDVPGKGLMYVDIKVNEKAIRAMVDTCATHNYISSTEVEGLGINSVAQPVTGISRSVLIKIGPYEGRTNFSVVIMDDFKLILGLEAGSTNSVADALSRRAKLDQVALMAMNAIVRADSRVAINIRKKIRKALTKDSIAQQLLKLIESGKTQQFWQEDGFANDQRKTGHAEGERTLALLQQGYYWPQMGDEVQEYVKTCLTCQQDKVERKYKVMLLQPLPVPKRPWESVSLNFITSLPKVEDLGTILVVVDRFSKYASFIVTPKYCSAEDTTHLFFKYMVKYWGMPQDIVSDRDSRFTGNFWTELFKLFGSQLLMSSSYHQESDNQTERFNSMLEEYLRYFVSAIQKALSSY
ncbi:hypothetical protein RJ639_028358 [Escallonia herrerae]|uniref:Integrase catalytic domain-containing protein n=1 Tax=Escallonia herrerae TaxID=1293975 RepID=A0AA88X5C2_9ASTE|nr:hypothetical protein RJ639_028358 [Escallonia herrerae]